MAKANWGEKAVWVGVYYGESPPGTNSVCVSEKVERLCPDGHVFESVRWKWDTDYDGDGMNDSNSGVLAANLSPYNFAQPKIHRNGCNVALFDGHVQWISYKEFWEFGENGYPVHPFWFNNNRP
jgi:prepilin-type processing-associated H-X9-DG protein